jgi:hypothetical protein
MLERYWGKYRDVIRWSGLAIGALTFSVALLLAGTGIGYWSGYYDGGADNYTTQYEAETQERIDECFAQVPVAGAQKCAEEAIRAGREDQRGEQDLSAQRQMAKWAYWLLIFTVAQSMLGILGFIALIITIRQGRDANDIARDNSHRELRAYLTSESVTLNDVDFNERKFVLDMTIVNHGQTPAKVLRVIFTALWQYDEGATVVIDQTREVGMFCHKQPPMSHPFEFDGTFEGVDRPGVLMVMGWIVYSDIFDRKDAVQFGWSMKPDKKKVLINYHNPTGFYAFAPDVIAEMILKRQKERSEDEGG